MEIIINWGDIKSENEFYEVFFRQVDAPEWHGRNLNALADSIVTGDINNIEPPYTIRSIDVSNIAESLEEFQLLVLNIFNEAVANGRSVTVINE